MTSFNINTLETNPQTLNGGEAGIIGPAGSLQVFAYPLTMNASTSLLLNGAIMGFGDGINGLNADAVQVIIGQTGSILTNGRGIVAEVTDNTQIVNHGTISGAVSALVLTEDLAAVVPVNHDVVNTGVISSINFQAIFFRHNTNGFTEITNSGVISSTNTAIVNDSSSGIAILRNTGDILAGQDVNVGGVIDYAYLGGSGGDHIFNQGFISGAIDLGGSGDSYTGTGNGSVTGEVHGGGGSDILRGASAMDRLFGDAGEDTLIGGDGDDILDGGSENDNVFGGAAHDHMLGGFGHDLLNGGTGNDTVDGGIGNDTIIGGDGNDSLDGGGGVDVIYGNLGDDYLFGGVNAFSDTLHGGSGDDTLDGGSGPDVLFGDAGHDSLVGGTNNDDLNGGWGEDTLLGGGGLDTLTGAQGDDLLSGGANPDTFVFGTSSGNDTITDFTNGLDRIDLSALNLPGFGNVMASNVNGSVLIDLDAMGGNGSILLDGFAIASLNAADFVF